MKVNKKSIILISKTSKPNFKVIEQQEFTFTEDAIVVKVLAFSIDPVMKVWMSGAKTNFSVVKEGGIMNCFGLGVVIQCKKENSGYKVGDYIFGNSGTTNYFELDSQVKSRECFKIQKQLLPNKNASRFLYLINNGLAAYSGYEILNPTEKQNVVVSTAAGATGLLLLHLLKKKKANIIAICSGTKQKYIQQHFTQNVINYSDKKLFNEKLKSIKFKKYFDNVGESQLDLILRYIDNFGTIALCGAIENYHNPKNGGITNFGVVVSKRLTLTGINFSSLIPKAYQIFEEFNDAELQIHEIGAEQFEDHFSRLLSGGNDIIGKVIVKMQQE